MTLMERIKAATPAAPQPLATPRCWYCDKRFTVDGRCAAMREVLPTYESYEPDPNYVVLSASSPNYG